jgi:hypothetical protein
MERELKGIWIPSEILSLGVIEMNRWVYQQYGINLYAKNPMEDES